MVELMVEYGPMVDEPRQGLTLPRIEVMKLGRLVYAQHLYTLPVLVKGLCGVL